MIWLFYAALAATFAIIMTTGIVMEVCMGIAGVLWIAVIITGQRNG
jgi:hypothetical protein